MDKIIYYSDGSDEFCHEIDHWEQHLEDAELNSIKLIEMKQDKKEPTRFCTLYREFLHGGECGVNECGDYSPQNGLRGKCTFKTFCLTETENKIIITTDTKFKED